MEALADDKIARMRGILQEIDALETELDRFTRIMNTVRELGERIKSL